MSAILHKPRCGNHNPTATTSESLSSVLSALAMLLTQQLHTILLNLMTVEFWTTIMDVGRLEQMNESNMFKATMLISQGTCHFTY